MAAELEQFEFFEGEVEAVFGEIGNQVVRLAVFDGAAGVAEIFHLIFFALLLQGFEFKRLFQLLCEALFLDGDVEEVLFEE